MRRFILPLVVAAAVSAPSEVQAQNPDYLSSSMTAFCVFSDCSQVQFTLDVFGAVIVRDITLSSSGNQWLFQQLVGVIRRNGTDATWLWTPTVSTDQLTLSAVGASTPEPIHFLVNMQPGVGASQQDLIGNITYAANGTYDGNISLPLHGITDPWTTSGTVTPEPSTWLLLGTGILGLGIVARRRRREDELEVATTD